MTTTLETDVQKENAGTGISPFVWYELHTPDAAAAAAFYAPVLGWTTHAAEVPNRSYTLICVGDVPVGGLLEKAADQAAWIGYLGVGDVDAYSKRLQDAGGVIHRAAEELAGVGTFAVAADPQGAIFTLFQPPAGMTRPEQPAACTPGMPAWNELGVKNLEAEFNFYSKLFGWTKAHAIDMGPNGVYQIFATGGEPAGGMMRVPDPAQAGGWLFYFHVAGIQAAIERVKQHGGVVMHGPSEVPGGAFTAQCLDPQGAAFGIVGPGRN